MCMHYVPQIGSMIGTVDMTQKIVNLPLLCISLKLYCYMYKIIR